MKIAFSAFDLVGIIQSDLANLPVTGKMSWPSRKKAQILE